jgi:hypothetical protein
MKSQYGFHNAVAAALLFLCCIGASWSAERPVPQIVAAAVSAPPVMDGRLDDPAWASATEVDGFTVLGFPDKRPTAPTYVRAVTDGKALYLGFRCVEPRIAEIKTEIKPRDVETWLQEDIEIVLDVKGDRQVYYHLFANISGGQCDSRCTPAINGTNDEDMKWNGDWELKTSRDDKEWFAEIKLPFSTFGADLEKNSVFGISLNRSRLIENELSTWSLNKVRFIEPANMGEVIIPNTNGEYAQVEFPRLSSIVVGSQSVPIEIINRTKSPIAPKLSYKITGDEESTGEVQLGSIAPGADLSAELPVKIAKQGADLLSLSVTDSGSGRTLYSSTREMKAVQPIVFNEMLYALHYKRADATFEVKVPSEKAKLKISLVKANSDKPIAVKTFDAPFSGPTKVSFSLTGQKQGAYKLLAELTRDGKIIAVSESALFPYKPNPKVGFDKNGFLKVEGKPFFPIGIYSLENRQWGADDAIMKDAHDAGFNSTVLYQVKLSELMPVLDACQRNGIKALVYPTIPFDQLTGKETPESTRADIDARRNHPAVIGWYMVDEPEGIGRAPSAMERKRYQFVKEYDQDHICAMVVTTPEAAKDYHLGADVMWIDPYPVPAQPVTYVSDCVGGEVKAVEKDQPVWCVPQAFDWSVFNTGKIKEMHRPTADEERCMTYLALVNGAKGIIYWPYNGMYYFITDYPEHWADMKRIAGELRDLTPVLLTPTVEKKLSADSKNAGIQMMLKKYKGSWYAFAVNGLTTGTKATFKLSGVAKGSKLDVLFENRSLASDEGSWTDEFKPLEVHVYKIPTR